MKTEFLNLNDLISEPIPIDPITVNGWKNVEIREIEEPLVALGGFSNYKLFATDAIYFGQGKNSPYYPTGLKGRLITPFVRQSVAERLDIAQQTILPEGYLFLIWDAYRPLEVQKALFEQYISELAIKKPELTETDLITEAQQFVSLPSTDPKKPSPHNTGGVADLTILRVPVPVWRNIRREWKSINYEMLDHEPTEKDKLISVRIKTGQMFRELGEILDMGTPFDYVGPETETNYYEKLANQKTLTLTERSIMLNRRLLFNSLRVMGFENYEEEWWHFSYGDQMWARKTNRVALFGAATLTKEDLDIEEKRHINYIFHTGVADGIMRINYIWPDADENKLTFQDYVKIYKMYQEAGDPRLSKYPTAIAI